jgi:hypothetical protein
MPVRQIAPENKRELKRFVALERELVGSESRCSSRRSGPT